MLNPRLVALTAVVITGAAIRLIPHPPNFAPIAAMALFGGAHFANKRAAFAVPLAAMFLSDLVLSGGYHAMMPVVYGCFAATVGLGMLLRWRRSILAIGVGSLCSSVLFYVATNFGVWAIFDLYPKTAAGFAGCYVAAIPFFRNTLAGDLFFCTLLFGAFALAERAFPKVRGTKYVKVNA